MAVLPEAAPPLFGTSSVEPARRGLAVSRGHLEISKDLLFRGASIQEKDRNANNLLHHAAGNGDIRMIEMLLGSGISKDAVNRDGHTPLMLALKRDHSETIPLLR